MSVGMIWFDLLILGVEQPLSLTFVGFFFLPLHRADSI